ncbi:MAG: helix-turn-helix transcriptional regulator [Clostridia bacterium]|nr:helix-turn-helix transcriptional regulator [Clostridia bacterium]
MENNSLGSKISQARIERNLSQRDLARLCYMTQTQICRLENGKSKPQLRTLAKIARCLELDIRELAKGLGYNEEDIDIQAEILQGRSILDKFSRLNSGDTILVEELISKIATISEKEKAIIRLILSQECPP